MGADCFGAVFHAVPGASLGQRFSKGQTMAHDLIPRTGHGGKITKPWRQFISKTGWQGDAVLDASSGTSSAVMKIDVPWDKLTEVVPEILGYSVASGVAISRMTPMRHPVFPWMRCTRITGIEGVGVLSDPLTGNSATKGPSGDYQSYRIARLTLQFTSMPYAIVDDGTYPADQEWRRYTERFEKPAAEFAARKSMRIRFHPAFSIGANWLPEVTDAVGVLLIKARVQVIWHQVPVRGFYNERGRASNVLDGLARVNSDTIFGYKPGTLLMEAPDIKPVGCPLDPALIGQEPSHYVTVTHNWLHFDPPLGNYAPGDNYGLRGHNTLPQPYDGKFYPTVLENGQPRFLPYRFSKCFEMSVDDT